VAQVSGPLAINVQRTGAKENITTKGVQRVGTELMLIVMTIMAGETTKTAAQMKMEVGAVIIAKTAMFIIREFMF